MTRTTEELSIVAVQDVVPASALADKGWSCFKVHGPIDFSVVGVLNSMTQPLASAGISLFAISTFDTDYVLVKKENVEEAIKVLIAFGHSIEAGN